MLLHTEAGEDLQGAAVLSWTRSAELRHLVVKLCISRSFCFRNVSRTFPLSDVMQKKMLIPPAALSGGRSKLWQLDFARKARPLRVGVARLEGFLGSDRSSYMMQLGYSTSTSTPGSHFLRPLLDRQGVTPTS